jgi:tetratricopeptide (TPR) repeat protein
MKILTLVAMASAAFAATPAEVAIEKAQAAIARQSEHAPYYNALAMAYARRACETDDPRYYSKAEEALGRSFALAPDNYEGLKTQVWLLLGRHEFAKALEAATRLNRKTPDDVIVYGYLVDANVALGNYQEAVAAAQWMLDLRAGNVAGLMRAAKLRELHGNLRGAMEFLEMAYDSTPYPDTDERASLLAQMAHLSLAMGDLAKAEMFANRALEVFPDYPDGLASLAQVRVAQKRFDEAVELLSKQCASAPRAATLYALAEAMELAGRLEESSRAFAKFERLSVLETNLADNSNHELVAYYVDHAGEPVKALEVAQREDERRKDVFTLDAYAWALAANGQLHAANEQMQKALKVGVKEPTIVAHAAFIREHLN